MNQQEQYAADVATGYPRPWELWEYEDTIIVCGVTSGYEFKPCAVSTPKPFSPGWHYRRRPDADEIIRAWRDQNELIDIEPVLTSIGPDSVVVPRTLLAEVLEIAETNTVDIKCQYIAGHGNRSRQSILDMYKKELATIARAKELL